MCMISHPNIVALKYHFNTSGEKVIFGRMLMRYVLDRRDLSESCFGIHSRNHISRLPALRKTEASNADVPSEGLLVETRLFSALYIPTLSCFGLHSFYGNLPSRHQATKSFVGSCIWRSQTL